MRRPSCRLRIFEISAGAAARDRALAIVDSLAERRPLGGVGPWTVTYTAADLSQAFRCCAEDLDAIDPRWVEVVDFEAVRHRPTEATVALAGPGPTRSSRP